MSFDLNIVSFDVPFPANYGGVIDVYYKLLWLKQAGVNIHLHCYSYGRQPAPELEQLCKKVYYYPRKTGLLSNLSVMPYTVKSRQSKELEKNLLSNNYPILFEVLHTCYLLNDDRFKDRKKIYRHSNIEHEYYKELAQSERSFVKRLFLKIEAFKLKRFENILHKANLILAVNQKDTLYFQTKYPEVPAVYLPSFHANEKVISKPGRGNFILFHGNLSISENYEAAAWLIQNVFSKIKHQVIVAGLNPPDFLKELCSQYSTIKLIANPSPSEMDALVSDAQLHALYTAQPTGLKLKLLNVLFAGRFVMCNAFMLSGTGLKANDGLIISNSAEEYLSGINALMQTEFTSSLISQREETVLPFNNIANAGKLIKAVF